MFRPSGRFSQEVAETVAGSIGQGMFRETYADVYTGEEIGAPAGARGYFAWDPSSTYVRRPPYFDGMPPEPGVVEDIAGARCLVSIGDSVTTDHISPAGAIRQDRRPAATSSSTASSAWGLGTRTGSRRAEPRGHGARHVRERAARNLLVPGSEGTWTVHLRRPSGTIFDVAERYRAEGTPLVVLAGKEYGSGSSRDWAAKGPNCSASARSSRRATSGSTARTS